MTERFLYDFEDCTGAKIIDFKKNKEYSLETVGDFRKIESLLNNLHKEKEYLKEKVLILENGMKELQESDGLDKDMVMNEQIRRSILLLLSYAERSSHLFIGKEYDAFIRLKEYMRIDKE